MQIQEDFIVETVFGLFIIEDFGDKDYDVATNLADSDQYYHIPKNLSESEIQRYFIELKEVDQLFRDILSLADEIDTIFLDNDEMITLTKSKPVFLFFDKTIGDAVLFACQPCFGKRRFFDFACFFLLTFRKMRRS